MRTIQDALERAVSLRNFRDVNRERFERDDDHVDIVTLATEVERLNRVAMGATAALAQIGEDGERVPLWTSFDDHTESW
jgi:hypothetical protein